MKEDPNVDSPWTTYNPNLERKLFKGKGEGGGAEIGRRCSMNALQLAIVR